MKLFKKILVPTDFSAHAEEATRIAVDLSKQYDASITLIYVYEPVTYPLPEGYVMYTPLQLEQMFSEFNTRLVAAKSAAESAGAERVEARMLQGLAAGEICDFAAHGQFDLIAMGTHGRTGLKRVLMGSVAERVVRLATCPVLTVRRPDESMA
jgi:nucleotide-binding universal stress UspA family protein